MKTFTEYLQDAFATHKVKDGSDAVRLLKWKQVEIIETAKTLELENDYWFNKFNEMYPDDVSETMKTHPK